VIELEKRAPEYKRARSLTLVVLAAQKKKLRINHKSVVISPVG